MTVARAATAAKKKDVVGDIRMSVLLLLALALAFSGLHSVLIDFGWWVGAFGIMVVVLAAAALTRYFARPRWAGSVAAVVASIVVLSLFFTADSSIAGIIPTGSTITRIIALSDAAGNSIARQSIPAISTTGIQFLLCWIVALIAILVDAAANWLRAPALVGIPLLIIVVAPSFIIASAADGFTFELVAAAYLLILLSRRRRIQPALAVPVAVIAVLGALVAPIVLPPVTPGGSAGSGVGILAETINPLIDLGADLRQSDPTPALSYTTTSSTGQYLRLTTLDNFSGKNWEPTTAKLNHSNLVSNIASPPGLTTAINTTAVSTRIEIDNTTSPWLPTPYPAVDINGLKGDWFWQANTLTVRSTDTSIQGQRYTVDSLAVDPSIQELRAAPSSADNPLAAVPAGLDPVVAATAKEVVGKAKTDFDKAVALQNWFRGGTFTYSTKAPAASGYDGSGLSVIVPFLEQKEGYCVHFATTMAVMARTLGIPSRVAVGFLPGTATHPGNGKTTVYRVTSSNLHAWPELYFTGVGWVRFEPTPGKGFEPNFPSAPGETDTGSNGTSSTPVPVSSSTSAPLKAPKLPNQGTTTKTKSALDASSSTTPVSVGGFAGFLVLLLLITPAFVRIGMRRNRFNRMRAGQDSAIMAWLELRLTARDLGIDARESSTPSQLAAQLAAYLEGRGAALAALDELRALVEDDRFGLPGYKYYGEQLADELTIVLRGLRAATPLGRRMIATALPPTLVDRALGRRLARA